MNQTGTARFSTNQGAYRAVDFVYHYTPTSVHTGPPQLKNMQTLAKKDT